jgi:transposase
MDVIPRRAPGLKRRSSDDMRRPVAVGRLSGGVHRSCTGAPWRDVPAGYPPWPTLYRWFRRWQRDGTWARILASLQTRADARGLIGWTVSVDSTISQADQHVAGARRDGHVQKEPPGGLQAEPGDHGLGRSAQGTAGVSSSLTGLSVCAAGVDAGSEAARRRSPDRIDSVARRGCRSSASDSGLIAVPWPSDAGSPARHVVFHLASTDHLQRHREHVVHRRMAEAAVERLL